MCAYVKFSNIRLKLYFKNSVFFHIFGNLSATIPDSIQLTHFKFDLKMMYFFTNLTSF